MHEIDWWRVIGIALLYVATAANLISIARHKTPQQALREEIRKCVEDKTGDCCFGAHMVRHHNGEEIRHQYMLRQYEQWKAERNIPITLQLINDAIVVDMLTRSLSIEDTPPDDG